MVESFNPVSTGSLVQLRVRNLDHFSYKAILVDTITVLKHTWWLVLIIVLASLAVQNWLKGQLVDFMNDSTGQPGAVSLYLIHLLRALIQALHFLAAAPVIVYFKQKLDAELISWQTILKVTTSVSWQVLLIGTFFEFALLFAPLATALYAPVRELMPALVVSIVVASVLLSFLVLFPVVAVFRRSGLVKTSAHSIRLIFGHWWKLFFLFPLLDLALFPYDLLSMIVPIEISKYVYWLMIGIPVSTIAIALSIVVFLMLESIREKSPRKSPIPL